MLSEQAEKIKAELEQAAYVNERIENLKTKKINLQSTGFPRGSSGCVDGGALNKTEEIYMAILGACAEIDEEIVKLEAANCEILRKVNALQHDWHCMIWDRYFTLPQATLRKLCHKYNYCDESYVNAVFCKIFERLVWL